MKTVFALFDIEKPELLAAAIARVYPNDNLKLNARAWLIAAEGTSQSVCEALGITVPGDPKGQPGALGGVMVVAASSYYGVASPNVWEWMRAKWGSA